MPCEAFLDKLLKGETEGKGVWDDAQSCTLADIDAFSNKTALYHHMVNAFANKKAQFEALPRSRRNHSRTP